MNLPKITVVTPSFNQANFLRQTIASVLSQGYPDLEYIVIDGGSSDGSREIIQANGSRLAYWCSEPDRGQADALRKGFERATGDILCWLNSDDVYMPGTLLTVGTFFANHPESEVLNGGGVVIDENGDLYVDGFWTYTEGVAASWRRLKWYGQDGAFQPSTFWRRSSYEAVGGINPGLYFQMDRDLFFRMAQRRRFDKTTQILSCFRHHPSSKSYLHQSRHSQDEEWFHAHYCKGAWPSAFRPAIYAFYRMQSLIRKARTSGAVRFGLKRFELPRPSEFVIQPTAASTSDGPTVLIS
jgi:glycosyltransferase involved in cell wall biosynthesis